MCRLCGYGRLYCSILILVALNYTQSLSFDKYLLQCNKDLLELSTLVGLSEVNTLELTNKNDGEVVKYLIAVGLNKGNPYCAAGQYWCFWQACKIMKLDYSNIPIPKTGLASSIYNYAKAKGDRADAKAQKNDLIIWKKKNSIFGHIERIIEVKGAGWVKTLAFNVSGAVGRKEGVFIKQRNLYHLLSRMRVHGLVGFINSK